MGRAILHDPPDPLPPAIALDTSFLVKVLNQRDPQSRRAYQLYEGLVRQGAVCAICWPILRLEFWFAWDRAVNALSARELEALAREVRAVLTGEAELELRGPKPATPEAARDHRLGEGERLLDVLLSTLRVARMRLTGALLDEARAIIVSSGLKPLDAVVCAVARQAAEATGTPPSVISLDGDFRRVDGLHVWGLR